MIRFSALMIRSEGDLVNGGEFKSKGKGRRCLLALCKTSFTLNEVMERAFWIILPLSMIFILLIYWDTIDEIEWEVPVELVGVMALLFGISRYVKYRQKRGLVKVADKITQVELEENRGIVTLNPISEDAPHHM